MLKKPVQHLEGTKIVVLDYADLTNPHVCQDNRVINPKTLKYNYLGGFIRFDRRGIRVPRIGPVDCARCTQPYHIAFCHSPTYMEVRHILNK